MSSHNQNNTIKAGIVPNIIPMRGRKVHSKYRKTIFTEHLLAAMEKDK